MKNRLLSVKADGTLKISIGSSWQGRIRKAHTWYTHKNWTFIAPFIFFVVDILGFYQIAEITIEDSLINRGIIMAALAAAFEIAPLYIGYAICLESYGLGKRIHGWIFGLSLVACLLGIIGYSVYRINTMEYAYGETDNIAFPLTILMILLPIITSLLNVVMGCLSFDPLLFEINHLTKQLKVLKLRERQLCSYFEELKDDKALKESLLGDEETCYNNSKIEIITMRLKFRNYIITRILSFDSAKMR